MGLGQRAAQCRPREVAEVAYAFLVTCCPHCHDVRKVTA